MTRAVVISHTVKSLCPYAGCKLSVRLKYVGNGSHIFFAAYGSAGGLIKVMPIRANKLPALLNRTVCKVIIIITDLRQAILSITLAADITNQSAVNNDQIMSLCLKSRTPIYYRATALTISASLITVIGACSGNISQS